MNSTEYLPRDRSIYVSGKTKKRLRWICEHMNGDAPAEKKINQDLLADQLLNKQMEDLYPNLPKLEKRLAALEDQLISELGNNKEAEWLLE